VRSKAFVVGLASGAIIAVLLMQLVGSRYRISSSGPQGIVKVKLDAWTGRPWMMRYYTKDNSAVWYWDEIRQARADKG